MTFLFDIGRVLLDFDFIPSLGRLLPADSPDRESRLARLLDRKDDFEAGAMHLDEYTVWAIEVLGIKSTSEEFHHAWQQIFTRNEPMWECARKLSDDGHRLILFSNTNSIHCPWIFSEFPEFSIFPEAILSYEVGAIKPHPAIYQHAIDRYGLIPSEVLYIDDLPENIATGREHGFRTWQYDLRNHAAFEVWLAENLKSEI